MALPRDMVVRMNLRSIWFYDPAKVTEDEVREVSLPLTIKGSSTTVLGILREMDFGSLGTEVRTLGTMTVPVLIVWGREDGTIPLALGEEMHRIIKGSEMAVIDTAGHTPHEEHPEEVARAMAGFLSK